MFRIQILLIHLIHPKAVVSAEAKGIIGRGRSERPARKGREDRQALDRVGKQVKTLLLLRYPLRNKKHMRTGSPLGAPQHLA